MNKADLINLAELLSLIVREGIPIPMYATERVRNLLDKVVADINRN